MGACVFVEMMVRYCFTVVDHYILNSLGNLISAPGDVY